MRGECQERNEGEHTASLASTAETPEPQRLEAPLLGAAKIFALVPNNPSEP